MQRDVPGTAVAGTDSQKALAQFDNLPGLENGNVFSADEIMAHQARPGKRVIVLDEGGNWKGCGTAWKLAEGGHGVTVVTPDPLVGKELQPTADDFALRQRLARLGAEFVTESAVAEWSGKAARIVSLLDGRERTIDADTLVNATAIVANNMLGRDLESRGLAITVIGDGVAPRQAPHAIHEGRKAALEIRP